MSKALRCRPSEILQIADEFEAYALDSAVVRWGTAFDHAVQEAVQGARNTNEAERRQATVVRRWIPEERRYANVR